MITKLDSPHNKHILRAQATSFKMSQALTTFNKFPMLEQLKYSLQSQNLLAPTAIQNLALPPLLKGNSAIVAAQTGTGKTLAYSLPLLNNLKHQELEAQCRLTIPFKPRALILLPNRELVQQVQDALKQFIYQVPLRIGSIYSGKRYNIERQDAQAGVDILIATLDRLQLMRKREKVFFSNLSALVVDQMDTFLDAGKGDAISQIISQVIGHNYLLNLNDQNKLGHTVKKLKQLQGRQVILASATISRQMEELIAHFWPDPPRLKQQNTFSSLIQSKTHYNLSNVKHQFIQIPETDKFQYLSLVMKEYSKYSKENQNTSAIIFCNSIKSVRATEYYLAQNSFKASSLHGDIPPNKRVTEYNNFKSRKIRILVATDLAARGLDFPFVSHVINFDFPKSASDYLHRAGRTGRAGRFGQVVSLYRKRDLGLITQMRDSNDLNQPLKIKGSAFSLKNKEDLIQTRLKDKNAKISLPKQWRQNKKLKEIRKKRLERIQLAKKSHAIMIAKGRFRGGSQRIQDFKVKKKEPYQSKRLEKKVQVKNKRLAFKWMTKNRRKLDYINAKNSRKL